MSITVSVVFLNLSIICCAFIRVKQNCLLEKPKNISKIDESQAIIQSLETKVKYITNKWSEEKNLVLQLKNDLKRANKWLQQEIGDKFETLLSLNNSNCTWRGRAQIICDLQQKNAELKAQLQRNDNG